MHANYFRPGGVSQDLPAGLLGDVSTFVDGFVSRINEVDVLLSANRIWQQRLKNVGVVNLETAQN
jgi:NADH dehydrogenase (ubiquinone) Fe-S protein 2